MQKNKKKILIFIPKLYHGGGAERSSLALKDLLSKEYEVSTLTIHNANEGLEDFSFAQKDHSKIINGFFLLKNAYDLKKFCIKNNVDVLIPSMPRANTITMLSKLFFNNKAKTILITRNANFYGFINKFFIKTLWKKAEYNVAVSEGSSSVLRSLGLDDAKTIFNPFDIEKIKELSLGQLQKPEHEKLFSDYTFLNIGRLHGQKGQDLLIESFSQFNKNNPETKLLIAGEGQKRKELEGLIEKLNLKDKVFLLGNIKNVYPYIKKADTFILSSLWEGLPTVLVESSILKKNIISSDCVSGPREILSKENILDKEIKTPYVADGGVILSDPKQKPELFKKDLVSAMGGYYSGKTKTDPSFFEDKVSSTKLLSDWMKIIDRLV